MTTFDEVYNAYKEQMEYFIRLLVNSDNAIDMAHRERCPLPFQSCMIADCIKDGKALQEGGAHYNFTGPQGFGIANMTDALFAIKQLVFEQKKYTGPVKEALEDNFGKGLSLDKVTELTSSVAKNLVAAGKNVGEAEVAQIFETIKNTGVSAEKAAFYNTMLEDIGITS